MVLIGDRGGLFFLTIFFFLTTLSAAAIEPDPAGAVVVVVITSEPGVAARVPLIVRTAIAVELRNHGISPVETDVRISATPDVPDDLFDSATELDGDFLLHVANSRDGDRLRLSGEFFALSDQSLVASARSTVNLDLTFDRAVADMTRAIIDDTRPLMAAAGSVRRQSEPDGPAEQSPRAVSDDNFDRSAEVGLGVSAPESRDTPRPCSYMRPRFNCANALPCSAAISINGKASRSERARRNHRAASA